MRIVFATHNQHKFEEVNKLVPSHIELVSLSTIGCYEEIPEIGKTLEENARIKADYITQNFDLPCIADDTGLMVKALDGAPGVLSARYAGPSKNNENNIAKLLSALDSHQNRNAYFKTIIALNVNERYHQFEGIASGRIIKEKRGTQGFGYDPVFVPDGYTRTFAELPLEEKNKISHRAMAVKQLIQFLKTGQYA